MILDVNEIRRATTAAHDAMTGEFKGWTLASAFQPIYSLAHKRMVGREALIRIQQANHGWEQPGALFHTKMNKSESVLLDRLCRLIHIHNYMKLQEEVNWLFLNVSPHTVVYGQEFGSFFGELLALTGFPAQRIVIEITEHPISNRTLLASTVNYYKSLGCLIALDDFGVGESNFDRIWSLRPDIVKLDCSFLVRASQQASVRQLMSNIVALLHQAGALVLMEGIETQDQAMIAMESDVDFVQGYLFGRPELGIPGYQSLAPLFERLFETYKQNATSQEQELSRLCHHYTCLFQAAKEQLQSGRSLAEACSDLFRNQRVIRCYLLTPSGVQVDHTVVSAQHRQQGDARFKPLEDAKSADWFRRQYLRQAILHPNQLQITRPYLSITGAHICMTLSQLFLTGHENRVLCCDVLCSPSDL